MLPPDDDGDRAARVMQTLASSSILEDPRADHLRARVESALFGTEEPPPQRVGRYRLLGSIGQGAMGEVVSAFDDVLERAVAIKLVHRTLVRSATATARLLQEARALARLNHPGVVHVYEAGISDGRAWIAMERVVGHDLRTWLKVERRSTAEILRVLVEAGRGLHAAHEIGLVHRDFKPDNVLVDEGGRPRVADFGLVRVFADAESDPGRSAPDRPADAAAQDQTPLTRTGVLLGTPAYMAPEQLQGAVADARSDQFAFCVTAWEALFGARPFLADSAEGLRRAILAGHVGPPPRSRRAPRAVVRALLRGLQVDPALRHPNLAALLDALSRPRPTRRVVAGALVGGAIVAAIVVARPGRSACDDVAANELWSPARNRAMRDAFEDSGLPYARPAADHAVARLDRWAADWTAAAQASCDDAGDSEPAKLERACLQHARLVFDTLVDSMAAAGPTAIENSSDALDRLPSVSACLDGSRSFAFAAPTEVSRAAAFADALAATGHSAAALGLAEIVGAEATARDDPDARIVALRVAARSRLDLGHTEAGLRDFMAAADFATASARDETATTIWTELSSVAAAEVRDAGRAAEWLARAEAWTARTGSDPTHGRLGLARAQVLALEDPDAAYRTLDDLLAASTEAGPDASALRLDLLRARASAAFELGRFAEAAADYRAILIASTERYGEDHPRTATCAYNLGIALDRAGSPEAIELYRRAARSWERLYPSGNPDVARVHVALANAELVRGDVEAARRHASEALDMLTRLHDPEVPVFAEALIALGSVHHAAGEYAAAADAHARALSIYEETLGPDHAFTAIARSNRGEALVHLGEPEAARRELERAAAELGRALPAEHPYLAYPEKGLGMVALDRARYEDAASHLRRARELAGDHDPLERAEIDYALARVAALSGDPAAEGLERARARAHALGPSALRRIAAIDRLVETRTVTRNFAPAGEGARGPF